MSKLNYMRELIILTIIFFLVGLSFLYAFRSTLAHADMGKVITANKINIWYQEFGNPANPTILLMMGNGAQGIYWPDEFCKLLASRFHVIRYDYRDTGLSSYFDFATHPYDFNDLADDAIGLLDALKIPKAHIVGLSMGGFLAQMIAIKYPDRVLSMTIMMTTSDYSVLTDALEGLTPMNEDLPPLKTEFVNQLASISPNATPAEAMVENWRAANGGKAPFDEIFWTALVAKTFSRTEHPDATKNHMLAARRTLKKNLFADLKNLNLPTLVIQGMEDPIFPPPHGQKTAEAIPGAQLLIIDDMGHALQPSFFHRVSQAIIQRAS